MTNLFDCIPCPMYRIMSASYGRLHYDYVQKVVSYCCLSSLQQVTTTRLVRAAEATRRDMRWITCDLLALD